MHRIVKMGANNPAYLTGAARKQYIDSLSDQIEKAIPHSSRVSLVNGSKYSRMKTFKIKYELEYADISPNTAPLEFKRKDGRPLTFHSDFGLTQESIDEFENYEDLFMESKPQAN
jgi:hypothetical protein